jgi:hypothetical protein
MAQLHAVVSNQKDSVVADLDIYRNATVLIEQYGENAPIFAATHAD